MRPSPFLLFDVLHRFQSPSQSLFYFVSPVSNGFSLRLFFCSGAKSGKKITMEINLYSDFTARKEILNLCERVSRFVVLFRLEVHHAKRDPIDHTYLYAREFPVWPARFVISGIGRQLFRDVSNLSVGNKTANTDGMSVSAATPTFYIFRSFWRPPSLANLPRRLPEEPSGERLTETWTFSRRIWVGDDRDASGWVPFPSYFLKFLIRTNHSIVVKRQSRSRNGLKRFPLSRGRSVNNRKSERGDSKTFPSDSLRDVQFPLGALPGPSRGLGGNSNRSLMEDVESGTRGYLPCFLDRDGRESTWQFIKSRERGLFEKDGDIFEFGTAILRDCAT